MLGRDLSNVNIRWLDENGQRISSGSTFTAASSGSYSVEVVPVGVVACGGGQQDFTVPDIADPVPVELVFTPFCGEDAFTTVSIEADLAPGDEISWFLLSNGTVESIPNTDGQESISVSSEGTYRVIVYNADGCELGQDEVDIVRSVSTPPVLEDKYTICASEDITRTLNPGTYDTYEWILENEIISTSADFTPTLPGTYELHVADGNGCEFTLEFVVEEDCELRITFPNAVVPGSDSKNFVIYANEFIDEVEALIYNRWGELIFYCTHQNVEPGTAFCPWDGIVNGKIVPTGTYPLIIRFKSENQGVEKTIKTAIVVIEIGRAHV